MGEDVIGGNIGVILHYFTPTEAEDTAGLFLMGSGTLEWTDGGVVRSCTIPAVSHTMETADDETWQRFDLSTCIHANGWALNPGTRSASAARSRSTPRGRSRAPTNSSRIFAVASSFRTDPPRRSVINSVTCSA